VKAVIQNLIGDIFLYSLPFLTTGITVIFTMAGIHLSRNYQNNKLIQALLILDQVVINVVNELNLTVVNELKAAKADGKLTRDEAEQIKHKAIEMALKSLGVDLLKTIQASLGPITSLLATKIEAAVFDNKRVKGKVFNKNKTGLSKVQLSRIR
jgi:hypothetical protein